jgi:hypothetical protein
MKKNHIRAVFWVVVCALVAVFTGTVEAQAPAAGAVPVTFQINDSYVKDKVLPGTFVGVATSETGDWLAKGETDATGKWSTSLAPGKYFVSYNRKGYVPLPSSPIEVDPTQSNLITVTLSMMMEEVGGAVQSRRVQIVLNWGSRREQVKDMDSYFTCGCEPSGSRVYYGNKVHTAADHKAELDVDDVDWGGPETITLTDLPTGSHTYYIDNFSGPVGGIPAADAVVRVIIGDTVTGEFRPSADAKGRGWYPFKAITVGAGGDTNIVPFTAAEIASHAHVVAGSSWATGDDEVWIVIGVVVAIGFFMLLIAGIFVYRKLFR